jgi:hypothetical protein
MLELLESRMNNVNAKIVMVMKIIFSIRKAGKVKINMLDRAIMEFHFQHI